MKSKKISNEELSSHPELQAAMGKIAGHARKTKRAVAGGGAKSGAISRPFQMVDTKWGGGEVIARAIQLEEKKDGSFVNVLPEDAVVVCVFKQYAKAEFGGPCIHKIVRMSETKPFDEKQYEAKAKKKPETEPEDKQQEPAN